VKNAITANKDKSFRITNRFEMIAQRYNKLMRQQIFRVKNLSQAIREEHPRTAQDDTTREKSERKRSYRDDM
jgi:hypothetical protein